MEFGPSVCRRGTVVERWGAGDERDQDDELGSIPRAECDALESRMLGNMHVRFGGGREETQFSWAPCFYLTGTRARGEAEPYCQEAHVTDVAMVRLYCRTQDTL